jgi:hypothetical protein
MSNPDIPWNVRPLFEQGTEVPETATKKQEIDDRKGESKRVVKRLAAIVEEHRLSAIPLGIVFTGEDLRSVINALRDHARGGSGAPVPGARDEIHGHVLNRLFEELVEEPSNILFTTVTGPDTTRYESMDPAFWTECLALMEKTYCP